MEKSNSKLRISFQAKVLVPVLAILILLIAITTWVVDWRMTKQFEGEASERLSRSKLVFEKFQDFHSESLLSRYRPSATEPRMKAVAMLDDPTTVRDIFSKEINPRNVGTDVILFHSEKLPNPEKFSRDRTIDLEEFESNSLPSVSLAFREEAANNAVILAGDRLFNIVSVPVSVSDHIAAVITYANEIGDEFARDISQMTGSEIVFLADNRVIASTLPEEQRKIFGENLEKFSTDHPDLSTGIKINLAGKHFFSRASVFKTGDTPLQYILLSSYEEQWRMLQKTQRILFGVRLAGLALAASILWVLIRRITQPLRELRDGAEAVGRGDFSRRINVSSSDECGELARSFNHMTENLKSSRDQLEKTVETLKTTRAQLVQSEKLSGIGEFVAGVAHELNNPLTSVIGFAELLHQQDVDEKQKKFSKRIVQSAERCHKIVQNLLSFARQHTPERKQASLNTIVESVIDILQYELRTSNIEIKKELAPELPPLLADAHQLQQVFLNILNNARQAMEGRTNSWVRVATRRVGEKLEAIFQDNGPGISEENLNKIFNPFFTTKPVGKGTGLGLSLSYGIIQEHGGDIRVQSKLGEGTTFTISLPVSTEAQDSASDRSNTSRFIKANGERVLVIDDEEPLLELVREILAASGYRVETLMDGETALRRLSEKPFDLILCDWKMPGLNGEQVFERLRTANPEMAERLIFMTADVMSEKTQQFLKDNKKVCLSKPFSLREFREVVGEFSRRSKDENPATSKNSARNRPEGCVA